jgi:Gpi18-like mannosyltransferase
MISSVNKFLWRIDPAWRTALGVFLLARLFYSLWSIVILTVYPLALQNTVLNGQPILAAFDLSANKGYVYSRQVDEQVLTFRMAGKNVVDTQTGSLWDIQTGKAISGKYAGQSFPPADETADGIFPYQGVYTNSAPVLTIWQRFDSNWYLKIAQSGYSEIDGSTAFFPLYPLLIKFFGFILGNNLLAGLLISNAALLGALVLLFKLSAEYFEVGVVRRSLVYIILFPTSFFFFAAYTEAPFLLMVLAAFLAAKRQRWLMAALFGSLAALTRLQGVLMFIPLVYMWWRQTDNRRWLNGMALVLIPLSTLSFLLYTRLSLIGMYQSTLNAIFVWPWMNIWTSAERLLTRQGTLIDLFNLLVTLFFGILCVVAWFKLPREWFFYSIAMFGAPLFRMTTVQPLVSMSRYVLVLFPLFCLLGKWGEKPWVNRVIVYTGFLAALYFSAQFFSWGWVA